MNAIQHYEVTAADRRKNALTRVGAALAPILLALPLPIVFVALYALAATTTAAAAFYLFMALITGGAGFVLGLIVMLLLFWHRAAWLKSLRERLAADGIKTAEVGWFEKELTSHERRSLRELDRSNRLLADAYRETLASRLTASRILSSTRDELLLVQRRQNKLKYLKSDNAASLQQELAGDQKRLETIEAAARRGSALAGNEQALRQLSERTQQLPLALEAARIEDEIRRELDAQQ